MSHQAGLQGNRVFLRTGRPMYLHAKYAPNRLPCCGERHRHTGSPPLSLLYSHQTHICHRPVCYRNLFALRKQEHPIPLLFQNEDCKYYYKNVVIEKKAGYRLNNGRNNSSAANLLILNYLEGNVKISTLLDSFQKSRGVPTFKKGEYSVVTENIVINIDVQAR